MRYTFTALMLAGVLAASGVAFAQTAKPASSASAKPAAAKPAAAATHSVQGVVKSVDIETIQAELDKLIEDITKALERDRLLGGNVKWTEIKRVETDDGNLGAYAACAITVEFEYVSEGTTP